MSELMMDRSKEQVCIQAPRGFAKSTMGVFMILHHILFDKGDKVVIIQSKTQPEAINRLTKIKNVLEYSKPFRDLFGYGGEGVSDTWTEKKIRSTIGGNAFSIRAVGTGMPVRGALETSKKLDDTRITLYYLDDPDDENNTITKEQMEKNYDKFAGGKEGLDTRTGRIIVVGTPIREGCIVERIHDTVGWHCQLYQAEDENGNLLWEEMRSHQWLADKKEEFRLQGRLSKFYSEYMCQIVGDEDQLFKEEYLKYYDGYVTHNEEEAFLHITHIGSGKNKVCLDKEIIKPVYIFLGIDPASSTQQTADYSVTFPIAYDGSDIYVLPYFRERVTPTFHANQIIETIQRLRPIRGHVETVGYQEMLRDYLREEMYQKGVFLSGLEKKFNSRTEKSVRLETLHPLFYNRRVHVQESMTAFIDELLMYPRGRHDDTLDGFYYATRKLIEPHHVAEDMNPKQLNDYELFMLQNQQNDKKWLAA